MLRDGVQRSYERTRAATRGPDVVAQVDPPGEMLRSKGAPGRGPVGSVRADLPALRRLAAAKGVTGHSGPYPLARSAIRSGGRTGYVQLEGRPAAPAEVDRPLVTAGRWVRPGGLVVERSFAESFHVGVGDRVALGRHTFRVAGIAVSAAMPPYPSVAWMLGGRTAPLGSVWLTGADLHRVVSAPDQLSYVLNLRLADPAAAPAFAAAHQAGVPSSADQAPPALLTTWQDVATQTGTIVRNERSALLTGSGLLVILAIAGVAVLVGARMTDQLRRVGLLKAVGATPGLVVSVLLAEYLVVALAGAVAGLLAGRLVAPALADPGAGVVGGAGALPFGASTIALVVAVALGVALVAALVPALRAARVSTVRALADTARAPRRIGWLMALSRRLPVPLLLGLRIAGRRPRRALLSLASVAVTVTGLVTALAAHSQLGGRASLITPGVADPRTDRLSHVLALITVTLVVQAAVNATFVTWATVLDARHTSALARALGATPRQVSAGLSMAQVLPALAGALLGVPGGVLLFDALSDDATYHPGVAAIAAVVLGSVAAIVALVSVPARIGARRPVAEALRA